MLVVGLVDAYILVNRFAGINESVGLKRDDDCVDRGWLINYAAKARGSLR